MEIIWTPEAEKDRLAVFEYIAADNPSAAITLDDRLVEVVSKLIDFPTMGTQGLISGTRELILEKHFRVIYELKGTTVWILALVHTSRQWTPL